MTATGVTFMGENSQLRPRQRLGHMLREAYSGAGGAKRLASDLRISERSARNLFDDHWPGDDTWAAIVRRFGDRVWKVVFAPEILPVLADLDEREARLARELEGLRALRREVVGPVEGAASGLAGDPAEAPGPVNLDLFGEGWP